MTPVLQISHLDKYFGRRHVLKDISFETYAGEVFGFLGPNGAGKTTTIKIVAGLLSMDGGSISIAGHDLQTDFEGAMQEIGGIVENPEFYKYLSGWEHLVMYTKLRGNVDERQLREAVHTVGLDHRIHEKVGKYSLGMRQRLGVAQAIVTKPKLLILDEPTNGLDPAGIKELRDVLKNLAHKEGTAVLVSSHLMSEMELMCDRVGVIADGELQSVHPIKELISATDKDCAEYVLEVGDALAGLRVLSDILPEGGYKLLDSQNLLAILPQQGAKKALADINRKLIRAGISLYTVSPKEDRKLEDVFIELTKAEGGGQIG